eukprot:4697564-Pyramimonas_sp.AAC.1
MPRLVNEYGLQPQKSMGNYQKYVDAVLGFRGRRDWGYRLTVPAYPTDRVSRGEIELSFKLPHTLLEDELADD